MKNLSIQLYSLREEKDFMNNLKRVSQIGYTGVEFAGYGDIPAKDMKKALDGFNLRAVGSHVGLDRLKNNLQEEIEYNLEAGNKYLICPYVDIKTRDDALRLAEDLNKIGEQCGRQGAYAGYHNHAHEFVKDGEQYLLDILFDNTDKNTVKAEIDVYWVTYAGENAIEYLLKYKDRLPLIHFKEIDGTDAKNNVTIGRGIIDFKTMIKNHPDAEYIVEQEHKEDSVTIWESIEEGYKNLIG